MVPKYSMKLDISPEFIPDFFYLLRWKLREFKCMPSSNYVYQDETKNIHEFRYEICVILNEEGTLGPDFSNYIGTYATLLLKYDVNNGDEHEVVIKLGEIESKDRYEPNRIPWRRELRRLGKMSLSFWLQSGVKKMIKEEDLCDKQLDLVFGNIQKALMETQKIIDNGPTTEYHTAVFFKSYRDFLDYHYKINDYYFFPAHSVSEEPWEDNHIGISKISKEFSADSSERKNFFELSMIGMLLGLITNRHFTLCEYSPRKSQEELGISNLQSCVERTSESKLLQYYKAIPEGEFHSVDSKEFGYSNIRIPDDANEIITKYNNLPPKIKGIVEDSISCYQLSLDLNETYPTFSLVALFSAMEAMVELDKGEIRQPATCPICSHSYNPKCPNCGNVYSLRGGASWRFIIDFVTRQLSLSQEEIEELESILRDAYSSIRSAAVHGAKLRGLEYDTDKKMQFYLPEDGNFQPPYQKIGYYFNSLREIYVSAILTWIKNT